MGIGFMIKGPIAIIIPVLVIGSFIMSLRNWEELSQLRVCRGAIIIAVIILPWFVTMLTIHGDEFKNHILGAELHDRIVHDTPFSLYYFGVIFRYYLPWSFFFIAALAVKIGPILATPTSLSSTKNYFSLLSKKLKIWHSYIIQKDNQSFLFSVIWVMWPLILFTLFRIEHSRYMLPVSVPIVMITAHFLSQLIETPRNFQRKIFKAPFYLTVIFYILIVTLTWAGILFFLPFSQPPVGLLSLSTLSTFGLVFLFLFYKTKKYFSMIIALSIIQIITLTSLSGNSLSFFNRYPMKKFANQILADSQIEKRIGLYQLGNHRARMGVMTGLPSIYLNNPEDLKLFIETQNNVYIVMRQSDWQSEFRNLPITITATDTGWKKKSLDKEEIELLLQDGLKPHLQEYSESYVLLKAKS
jgi:4-amino-4-deoxy-L-arabinose transferase-like glycosyltransferase